MIRKILPILLALIGLGAGVGAGVALRPEPVAEMENPCGDMEYMQTAAMEKPSEEDGEEEAQFDYVKLNNQFVVPVVKEGRIASLVVMSLTLEVELGQQEAIYLKEPKLRDIFLQVLFDHANVGGFDGAFTEAPRMNSLRKNLLERAQFEISKVINDVLIMDIVRQDAAQQ